jgi:hypothetical protein
MEKILIWKQTDVILQGTEQALKVAGGDDILKRLLVKVPSVENITSSDVLKALSAELDIGSWEEEEVGMYFENAFIEIFPKIQLYHACRPINLKSYLDNGILKANQAQLEFEARKLWLPDGSSLEIRRRVEDAIASFGQFFRDYNKRVFLAVDDNILLSYAGHYLISGSEYLQSVAVRIDQNLETKYRESLKNRGIPTMIYCHLNTLDLREMLRHLWAKLIVGYLFYRGGDRSGLLELDYTVTVDHVHPENIAGHYHPTKILDPHNGMTPYYPKQTNCELCR